jgi:hypothetical protein
MSRVLTGVALVALAAAVGCGQSTPTQPQLTAEQIQEQMKQGGMQRERSDTRGGLGPTAPKSPRTGP